MITPEQLATELTEIAAESIHWQPLAPGAYVHVADPDAMVIEVVGVPDVRMAGIAVLLLV